MEKIKIALWSGIILAVIVLAYFSFFAGQQSARPSDGVSIGNYASLPEECRPAPGYSIEAWKEHLSHHENTQPCLRYFS